MLSIRMCNVLRIMIAAGDVEALPVGVNWPVHRALAWLGSEAEGCGTDLSLTFKSWPDPDACIAVEGGDDAVAALIAEGFLVKCGAGYTARWAICPRAATDARRALMREGPLTAALFVQAGQRLATWSSTALKNSDTAAASWAFTVDGPIPTVRQPRLVALR